MQSDVRRDFAVIPENSLARFISKVLLGACGLAIFLKLLASSAVGVVFRLANGRLDTNTTFDLLAKLRSLLLFAFPGPAVLFVAASSLLNMRICSSHGDS